MYRAMIVEDEPLMRQYLMEKLNELHPDWQAAAEASDGLEAMVLLQKELFDLVITDIRMAGMDGLSLARYVAASHPTTFVIILSGYDEFDYARTAVRLNVCDYLLKPLNDDELSCALEKVSQKIAEQKKRRQVDSCFPALFRDALAGKSKDGLAEYSPKLYGTPETAGKEHWGMMVFAPNLLDAARLQEAKGLHNIRQRLFDLAFHSFSGLAAMDAQGNTAVLLFVKDPLLVKTECLKGCRQINQTFLAETGISLLGGFSKPCHDLDALKSAYEEALSALFLAQAGDVPFLSGDLLFAQRTRLHKLQSLAEGFREAALGNNEQQGSSLCYQASSLLESPIQTADIIMLGVFLLQQLSQDDRLMRGIQLLLQEHWDELPSAAACARAYEGCLLPLISRETGTPQEAKLSLLTQKVQEYLREHFQEGVSLSMVADAFHVTPSYLSALFHKEVGESYSKYLLRVRMEYAAMKLLGDPSIKMYDVARQAGFASSKHFIQVFRTFYGKTPKEYQEKHVSARI